MRNRLFFKIISAIMIFSIMYNSIIAVELNFNDNTKEYENSNFSSLLANKKNINLKIMKIIESINVSLIMRYLETIVGYGPRLTGTYGCEKTAKYIYNEFQDYGLETCYQNWTKFHLGRKQFRPKPRFLKSQNIEATLIGKNDSKNNIIIFNAHYDTVKKSPGADDDGSGTAAVLASAYVLSKFNFEHTIKFITFSGEEQGLYGSRIYAKEAYEKNKNIIVEFNADMIGYCNSTEGENRFRLSGTKDVKWIMDEIDKLNIDYNFNFDLPRWTISEEGPGGSDYFSFVQYGFESIAFWEGEWNKNMHSPNDDLNNVNINYLLKTTQFITAILATIADINIIHPQISIESPKRGKLYFEGREKRDLIDFNKDIIKTIIIDDIWIWADVKFGDTPIKKVEFYYDGKLQHVDDSKPFKWKLNKISLLKHEIRVVVYDELNRSASDWMKILFINPKK
jgi:hypothetical protein